MPMERSAQEMMGVDGQVETRQRHEGLKRRGEVWRSKARRSGIWKNKARQSSVCTDKIPQGGKGRRIAASVLACVLAASVLLAGCEEKTDPAENLTFENEGQTYVTATKAVVSESSSDYDKEESVQVEADASGAVKKITVETRLRHGGGDGIEDYSNLTDIKNTEGDEEFTQTADGRLVWENHGEDIYYEGNTTAELPVELKISYELDGRAVRPKELAGKSGELRMRFDYVNKTAETVTVGDKEVEVCVPFTVISMAVLPEDVFSNVHVDNGR